MGISKQKHLLNKTPELGKINEGKHTESKCSLRIEVRSRKMSLQAH